MPNIFGKLGIPLTLLILFQISFVVVWWVIDDRKSLQDDLLLCFIVLFALNILNSIAFYRILVFLYLLRAFLFAFTSSSHCLSHHENFECGVFLDVYGIDSLAACNTALLKRLTLRSTFLRSSDTSSKCFLAFSKNAFQSSLCYCTFQFLIWVGASHLDGNWEVIATVQVRFRLRFCIWCQPKHQWN